MLDALVRCSRHRWRIFKLPPRRMERRLLVSATWFAELLARRNVGHVDLIFSSEALNLAELLRLRPELAGRPSVVYFHDNQLPDPSQQQQLPQDQEPTDLVNLNSAMAASEIWFNSLYNLRTFLSRASALVARHEELQIRNPMQSLTGKAHLLPPPIDLSTMQRMAFDVALEAPAGQFNSRSLLVDGRGVDHAIIAQALDALRQHEGNLDVQIIARSRDLPESLRPMTLDERDEAAHLRALLGASVFVSTRSDAASDDLAVRALSCGCQPIVPNTGVYPEIVPHPLHERCLHDGTSDSIVGLVLDAWRLERPSGLEMLIDEILERFDPIRACRMIDDRLEALAGGAANPVEKPKVQFVRKGRKMVGIA